MPSDRPADREAFEISATKSGGHDRMAVPGMAPSEFQEDDAVERRKSLIQQYQAGLLSMETQTTQERIRVMVVSAPWIALQILAVLLDVVQTLVTWDDSPNSTTAVLHHETGWNSVTIIVNIVYWFDIILRIYAFGAPLFFSKLWNWFDFLIVVSATIAVVMSYMVSGTNMTFLGLGKITRVLRVLRMVRATMMGRKTSQGCCDSMRLITGENKQRYMSAVDDFNLDLNYITPRLISMSVPAAGFLTRFYRNPIKEVVRFFELYHKGHYLIVNMCPEHPYDGSLFETGRVECFDVQDHTPPLMRDVLTFLGMADQWQSASHENIVACHCRGGKGRTGSFCCAWLLYSRKASDADDALNFFAMQRTDLQQATRKLQGVETPSQVRYVEYMDQLLRHQNAYTPTPVSPPTPKPVQLQMLTIKDLCVGPLPEEAVAVVYDVAEKRIVYCSQVGVGSWSLGGAVVSGDIRVSVFGRDKKIPKDVSVEQAVIEDSKKSKRQIAGKERGCLFYIILHTSFLHGGELIVPAHMIDKASKLIPKKYHPHGCLTMTFSEVSPSGPPPSSQPEPNMTQAPSENRGTIFNPVLQNDIPGVAKSHPFRD